MVVGARWPGPSISDTADLLGFPTIAIFRVGGDNGLKKRKYPGSHSCVEENALLMSEAREVITNEVFQSNLNISKCTTY